MGKLKDLQDTGKEIKEFLRKNFWPFFLTLLFCSIIVIFLFQIDIIRWSWSENVADISIPMKEVFL